MVSRNAVGFYWTLPVPWSGFRALPREIEQAARSSRTIRYQMEVIRSYARENGYKLIREEAFLEIEPDRGSEHMLVVLNKLSSYCLAYNATLIYVDFSLAQGWRSHGPMMEWSRRTSIEIVGVWPEVALIDGKLFDPQNHFRRWRKRQESWRGEKGDRIRLACQRVEALRLAGLTNEKIAGVLNEEDIRSATGKPWSGEMVRKLRCQSNPSEQEDW